MDSHLLQQDTVLVAINPETLYQEPQRTFTRGKPCCLQGCLLCRTSSTHVPNLEADLDSSNASSTPLTSDELPQPPHDHPILCLNTTLQLAIQRNNIKELNAFTKLYDTNLESNLEFCLFNRSVIETTYLTAMKILDSHTAINTPLPSSPPNSSTSTHPNHSPYAHFMAPKVSAQKWSGKILHLASQCLAWIQISRLPQPDQAKINPRGHSNGKQGLLNDVTEWDLFKERLIEEFGSIEVYGRDVNPGFCPPSLV